MAPAYLTRFEATVDGPVAASAVYRDGAWFMVTRSAAYGLRDARGGPAEFAEAVRRSIWPPDPREWPEFAVFAEGDPMRLVSLPEAARLAGVTRMTMFRRHKRGWLPTERTMAGSLRVRLAHAAMPVPLLPDDAAYEGVVGWSEPVVVVAGVIVRPS